MVFELGLAAHTASLPLLRRAALINQDPTYVE
jgi:hypothetical protein